MSLAERIELKHLHPAFLPREMRWRGIAYASFFCCGLILLGAVLLNWIPTHTWVYSGLAWLYRRPILLVFTLAAVLGAAFSLVAWREGRLIVLSLATLLTAWIPWLVMRWPAIPDRLVVGYLSAYIALALALPLWWMFVDRRRLLRRYPPYSDRGWLDSD